MRDIDNAPHAQGLGIRLSSWVYRHPRAILWALLAPVLLWLGVFYLGSLFLMAIQSFYTYDDFSGTIFPEFSIAAYQELFSPTNIEIIIRTFLMAASVTLACALIAFPLAYYMARYASARARSLLYLAVLLPLWSSYLVRVYSWKLILANDGILNWGFESLGMGGVRDAILGLPIIGGQSLSFSFLGMFLVFVYIWIPYMILPINAALERVPRSMLDASSDLGARPSYTFRKIILPLTFPGVVAGSIFTFSLTLGDYIIPRVIGDSSPFIGSTVHRLYGTTGNLPLAAAYTLVPMAIMGVYLLVARRLGAFDAL